MSTQSTSRLAPLLASAGLALALAVLAAAGLRHASAPTPVAADAPAQDFSAARAMAHLGQIARAPHPIGTPANAAVRDYLVAELTRMGLTPAIRAGIGLRGNDVAGNVRNVVVRLPGRLPGKALLLAAHYDSAPHSLGAADDGASVAAILETLRALTHGPRLANDVIALFTDGEEAGLLGAEAFTAGDPWARDVAVVGNFEYRGNAGPLLMYQTSAGNGKLIEGLQRAPHPLGNSLMYEVYKRMPNDTDMTAFLRAGMAGLNFGAIEGLTSYHSVLDRADRLDPGSLQHQGDIMLALARHFGNAPLDDLASGDSVYFDMAGLGMVSYSVSYVLPLCGAGILLFGAATWLARRNGQARLAHIGIAALLHVGLVAAAAVGTQLLWLGLRKRHPEYTLMLLGDTYNSQGYLAAFCALTVGIVWLIQARLRGRFRSAELGLGAALLWLLLLSAASVAMPGASFLLLWPLVAALASFAACFSAWGTRQPHAVRAAILLLGAAPGVVLFAPFLRQIFIALTPQLAAVPMVLLVLLLGLMAPLLCRLAGYRVLPLACVVAGVGLLASAGADAGFSAGRPQPNSLSYAQAGAQGYWLSMDRDLDRWTRQFFPGATIGTVPEVFGASPIHRYYAATASRGLPAPVAEVVADTVAGDRRTVTLRLRSARQAAKIGLQVEGTDVLAARFEERPLPGLPSAHWQMTLYAVPAEGNLLTLTLRPGTPFQLRVTDTTYGLPLAPRQMRPTDMMAQPFRDSDSTHVVSLARFR